MTLSLRALVFVSVIVCTLLLRKSQGDDGNVTDFENVTNPSTTSIAVTASTTAITSTIAPSNTTLNITVDGTLLFNSTNGTSVPLVGPTSAMPTQGSAGGGGGQRFDVASFIGGIILAAGVIGLGVFIFKVYQSRQSEYSNI